jgi:homocysteine S-methyltransferase
MNPLAPFLERQGVVILDGGLATELERRGADLRDALWSARLLLDDPGLVREVHRAWFEAGADAVATASYQASLDGLRRRGLGASEAVRLMSRSVELVCEAREQFWAGPARTAGRLYPLVVGSVGPYGAALADGSEYRGNYGVDRDALATFHRPRLEALHAGGVDLVALETFPSPGEVEVVLRLLEHWPELTCWVSFSCRDGSHVAEGQALGEATRAVEGHPQVVAVGANCVRPALADEILRHIGGATDKPLVIYPNRGEAWDAVARCWVGTADQFDPAVDAPRWVSLGARLVGGCCRTTPDLIRALRRALLADQ